MRFDGQGIRWPSVWGWRRASWSEVREVKLIQDTRGPFIRVLLPLSELRFSGSAFADPVRVTQTLRAEAERHKKPSEEAF